MSTHLLECPSCHVSFPVDRETMRVAEPEPVQFGGATVSPAALESVRGILETRCSDFVWTPLEDDPPAADRCQSPSCGCNRDPEDAA